MDKLKSKIISDSASRLLTVWPNLKEKTENFFAILSSVTKTRILLGAVLPAHNKEEVFALSQVAPPFRMAGYWGSWEWIHLGLKRTALQTGGLNLWDIVGLWKN